MTYHELVDAVRAAYAQADASGIKEHIAYQFNIEGEGEGAFYLEIADGKINIEPYEYYDRDVLFTTKAETLLKIGTGKLDPIWAVTTGKLKFEGNIDKALKLKEITPKSVDVTIQSAPAEEPEKASAESQTAAEETEKAPAEPETAADKPEKEPEASAAPVKESGAGFGKKRPGHKMKKKRR